MNYIKRYARFDEISESDVPPGAQIIPLIEDFKIKADGEFKVRICSRGDKQKKSISVFAPTVSAAAIRILVEFAVQTQNELQQADVKAAFLHGTLKSPVYI